MNLSYNGLSRSGLVQALREFELQCSGSWEKCRCLNALYRSKCDSRGLGSGVFYTPFSNYATFNVPEE